MLLPIIKPKDKSKSMFSCAAPGSVFVAIHHQVPGDQDGLYKVYYEGGIYSRKDRPPTPEEKLDYAKQAAGRASQNYPTVAKFYLIDLVNVDQIGHVDTDTWEVEFYKEASIGQES